MNMMKGWTMLPILVVAFICISSGMSALPWKAVKRDASIAFVLENLEFLQHIPANTLEELSGVFDLMDTMLADSNDGGDAAISKAELTETFEFVLDPATPEEIQSMLTLADKDGNGSVNFEEYLKVMIIPHHGYDRQAGTLWNELVYRDLLGYDI